MPLGGFGSMASLRAMGYKSPNERLNLAAIGAGGQPFSDLRNSVAGVENVVALADCDEKRGEPGFKTWPKAARYRDFRQMLDRSGKEIDAVVIGTPDHMHAACAIACMQLGKHVYVEKPLTRTAWEARLMTRAAAKYKVATQMGNQGYSHDATRVACEIVWSGEIGDVKEVHAWTGRPSWPQGMASLPAKSPVPTTLDWDLWLGTAAWREFSEGDGAYSSFVDARNERNGGRGGREFGFYLPFNWRGFYDFGSSLIGDWGVHILGPVNWALQLSPESLLSVECVKKDGLPPYTFPDELTIRYEFGPRGSMPPVAVYWYQHAGGDPYTPPGMSVAEARKIAGTGPQVWPMPGQGGFTPGSGGARPTTPNAAGRPGGGSRTAENRSGYNSIMVGTKGCLGTSGRGEGVGLLPGSRWAEYKLPNPYLSRSPGASTGSNHSAHCRDWVRACKGGAVACSNFSIAGPYTEWLVLGAAAVHADSKLLWDNTRGEFRSSAGVNSWVKPVYRKGWEISL